MRQGQSSQIRQRNPRQSHPAERGERNVSLENIFAIAEALKVAPGSLLKPMAVKGSD